MGWAEMSEQQRQQYFADVRAQNAEKNRLAQEKAAKDKVDAEQAPYKYRLDMVQKQREEDLAKGRERGAQVFGDNSLGRINEERSADVKNLIERRKANLEGYTPEEMNAMRDKGNIAANRAQQGGLREAIIANARSGVKGATATAGQKKIIQEVARKKAENERDVFLGNVAEKRSALGAAEQTIGAAETLDAQRQQYNIGQKNKELYGRVATELGYGSLGAGERASVMQQILGEKQAATAAGMPTGKK